MAEYYVDGINGDDSNSGTSPTNAWATVDKAMQTLAAGDICHIRPGVYRQTSTLTPANSGNATDGYIEYIGDTDGEIWGEKGEVRITTLSSDEVTYTSYNYFLKLENKSYIKFKNIFFQYVIDGTARTGILISAANYIEFSHCYFSELGGTSSVTKFIYISYNSNHTSIHHCIFDATQKSATYSRMSAVSWSANDSGYITEFYNNIVIGFPLAFELSNYNSYTNFTFKIYNNIFIVKKLFYSYYDRDYPGIYFYNNICNFVYDPGNTNNINAGNNYGSRAVSDIGVTQKYNLFFLNFDKFPFRKNIMADIDALGVDNSYLASDDFFDNPRPLKTGGDIGAVEYNPPEEKETTEVRTGSYSLKLTSASFKDIKTFLPAGSYTISVYTKWSGYSGSDKPQLIVKKDEYCGINSDQVATATGDGTSWEQLSVNITLTKDAEITIRLYARDTGSSAVTYFDDLSIS